MAAMSGLRGEDYFQGFELGIGISSLGLRVRGQAIQGTKAPETAGSDTSPSIDLATSQQDFFQSLGISAEVSGSY
jgi:hypothetical protein